MARKEVLRLSSVLLLVLQINSSDDVNLANKTEIIYATAPLTAVVTASNNSHNRLAKTFSVAESVKTVKNGFDAALHSKPDYTYSSSWSNNDTIESSMSRREENKKKNSSSTLTDAIRDITGSGLKKYTHLHRYQHPTTERSFLYASHLQPPDDFETQAQNYDAEYFPASNHEYEENYNSLSDDLSIGPPGYPPITTNYQDYLPEQPGVVTLSPSGPSCHCPPSRVTRQGCGSMFSEFLGLAGALGGNAWALAQLLGTSAAPFVIPLLVVKLILVPLKILKFLNLVKIFLKVFIILPFFVRYVYPALYNYTTSLPGMFAQQFHNIFGSQSQKPHHPLLHKPHKPRPYEEIEETDDDVQDNAVAAASATDDDEDDDLIDLEDLEGRSPGGVNGTKVNDASMWDLRGCPSRVACELGAFLAGSANSRSFPENLVNFLDRDARTAKDEEKDEIQRNAVYKAFVLALVRKWPVERCGVFYVCPVLF